MAGWMIWAVLGTCGRLRRLMAMVGGEYAGDDSDSGRCDKERVGGMFVH